MNIYDREKKVENWIKDHRGKWWLILGAIAIIMNLTQFLLLGSPKWLKLGLGAGFFYWLIFIAVDYFGH